MNKLKNTTQKFFRNLYKVIKLNSFYNIDLKDLDLEKEINIIITNFILLSNDGKYNRFNSKDFYSKSSKIKLISNSISKLQAYRNQFPTEGKKIKYLLELVNAYFKNLTGAINEIFDIIELRNLREKELFFAIRNLIVQEWINRNIYDPESIISKKDLNYLNYTLEEYQNYLNNCFNLLIRDTKKFITRYPIEYKNNPDLDIEILISLKDSIYNDIKFIIPTDIQNDNFNIFEIIKNFEANKDINDIQNPSDKIILRGWFKDLPNNCKIDSLKYKNYRKTI